MFMSSSRQMTHESPRQPRPFHDPTSAADGSGSEHHGVFSRQFKYLSLFWVATMLHRFFAVSASNCIDHDGEAC
jgi:hypothetical protein